jgi:3',5'-cyclic AMP phosphodiesterase CpdA
VRRFFRPLERYRRYITDDLAPRFVDGEVAIIGINTARSLTFKNGRISREQIAYVREMFCGFPASLFKILVTHHPFAAPPHGDDDEIVGRAHLAAEALRGCGVDMILAGHGHIAYSGDLGVHLPAAASLLVVQAGTALSDRLRGEPNQYNLLSICRDGGVEVALRTWREGVFRATDRRRYVRRGDCWELEQEIEP